MAQELLLPLWCEPHWPSWLFLGLFQGNFLSISWVNLILFLRAQLCWREWGCCYFRCCRSLLMSFVTPRSQVKCWRRFGLKLPSLPVYLGYICWRIKLDECWRPGSLVCCFLYVSGKATHAACLRKDVTLGNHPNPNLFKYSHRIHCVKETCFKGLLFDSRLTWIPHLRSLKVSCFHVYSSATAILLESLTQFNTLE